MPIPISDLIQALRARARDLGLDELRVGPARLPEATQQRYRRFLALGRHGTMEWLAGTAERRATPEGLWPAARSAIVCGMSYGPDMDPRAELEQRARGYISV